MGIQNSEMDYNRVIKDLENCCLKEENCGTCNKKDCIVGYGQTCLTRCMKDGVTYVEDGTDHIPYTDFKVYDEEEFEKGIAHILKLCRSCQYEHFDNCIISVLRNCYEIGLFGEARKYEGSNFKYLAALHAQYPEKGQRVLDEFHNTAEYEGGEE